MSTASTRNAVVAAARRNGVDPALLLSLANWESGFNQNKVSEDGAIGVMQLMPAAAHDVGVDRNDELQNIEGGARYLRKMLDMFGDTSIALAAYNAGPRNVRKYGNKIPPFPETIKYVKGILAARPRFELPVATEGPPTEVAVSLPPGPEIISPAAGGGPPPDFPPGDQNLPGSWSPGLPAPAPWLEPSPLPSSPGSSSAEDSGIAGDAPGAKPNPGPGPVVEPLPGASRSLLGLLNAVFRWIALWKRSKP